MFTNIGEWAVDWMIACTDFWSMHTTLLGSIYGACAAGITIGILGLIVLFSANLKAKKQGKKANE